ncbi:MAG: carbohydrate kinase family protein [Bacteroidetes bacterium]|nr:MAG: carbohydrate kinase family protein [Bacteroidota bacterium]
MQTRKIAVLGPIPKDHITTARGLEIEKLGCVTHPAIALSKLLAGQGTVIPVAHLFRSDLPEVTALFAPYPNIDIRCLMTHKDQGTQIQLRFLDQNNRVERQVAFMHPILPEDLESILDCDAFVLVPITDFEIPQATLRYLKENARPDATIIFDAHGVTSVATNTGDRLRKFWIDRDLWLPYIDVLKMNIEEAGCCHFKKRYTTEELSAEPPELTEDQRLEFATYALQKGVKAVYITLDSRGCAIYYKAAGEVRHTFVPSVKVGEVIDTTGCGDSFAGGLAFGLLGHPDNWVRAARYANALGALRTQGTTFEVFRSLEETNALIVENYGTTD